MKLIRAIYENGVFRPIDPVDLPESSHVLIELKLVPPHENAVSLDDVYAVLNKRFDSGQRDVAERHDEHQ